LIVVLFAGFARAQSCTGIVATPSLDYSYVVGSAQAAAAPGAGYQWLVNGQSAASGQVSQLFLLHGDGNLLSGEGKSPLDSKAVSFVAGKWGSAVTVGAGGALSYARNGGLNVGEGTIEMWIAPLADGSDPRYAAREHALFYYLAANGDYLKVAQNNKGVVYGGATVGGQWESAYNSNTLMQAWHAGEWHHVAFTFSASANKMKFYLDGMLQADTNEKQYVPPAASGDRFFLGTTPTGTAAAYAIDEVRISSLAMDASTIAENAARQDQPRNDESWLPLSPIAAGSNLVFQIGACASPAFAYLGIPITQPNPASTLLPPGTTQIQFSAQSVQPASCGYAVGAAPSYASMTPFDSGQGTLSHQTVVRGLSPDTLQMNDVYVRCDSAPGYALHLLYRSLPAINPHFPRKGNLWGSAGVMAGGVPHAARIDLYLGANFTATQIKALRQLNPNILILTSINTVENQGLPDDYYLKDIHGNKIEVWPNTYRLNLTKPYVAEYQAQFAYQSMLNTGMMVDGCFFDNFFTTQSWLKTDIYGNPIQIDADGDGKPDDPATLDAAWRAGVFHELDTWRSLMPNAYASGHLPRPPDSDTTGVFNGDSFGFWTTYVLEGKQTFQSFWNIYNNWYVDGHKPVITMTEAAPPFQIGYGYDYSPLTHIPPSTLEFARTYYPYMRFGLMFTLMNDGYFAYEFGDTQHGQDWWYDELDFDLGNAQGPATLVTPNIYRRDFDNGIVLLNASNIRQTVATGNGFSRIKGDQAPRHEYIVDDLAPAFSFTGSWEQVVYDSGMWKAAGPFYHNWGAFCHELDGKTGAAQWNLALREDDTYTIAAWWAAAPTASTWSNSVVFEVISGGQVVASTTVDQTTGGDQWHVIATVPLTVAGAPYVRIRNQGSGAAIADALHVMSAARYNDGLPAPSVTLEPLDGIVLQRTRPGAPVRRRP
jgi:hypothetical protein